jgi:hypothetical protein
MDVAELLDQSCAVDDKPAVIAPAAPAPAEVVEAVPA